MVSKTATIIDTANEGWQSSIVFGLSVHLSGCPLVVTMLSHLFPNFYKFQLSINFINILDRFEYRLYGRADKILVLITSASSDGSDKPVHMHSLPRAFAFYIQDRRRKRKAQTRKFDI